MKKYKIHKIYILLLFIIFLSTFFIFFNSNESFATYSRKEKKCVPIDNLKEYEYLQQKFKPKNCLKNMYNINVDYIDHPNLSNTTFVQQETLDAINQYPQTGYFIDSLMAGEFKPQCCPSTYTTSHGCLCKSHKTFDLIVTRGGNRASIPIVHY